MKMTATFAALVLILPALVLADPPEGSGPTTQPRPKKVEKPPHFIPATPDPMVGDWQGAGGGFVAQVFKTAGGGYQANLLKAFDVEGDPVATLKGEQANGVVTLTGDGWTATIQNSHFTGSKGDQNFDLGHVTRTSPTLGAAPPPGAVVLFDGHNLDAWVKKAGKDWLTEDGPARWTVNTDQGYVDIVPGSDCIITHQKFGDCHLHVEFRTIGSPSKSAVFLETRYEVNINDSYGKTQGNGTGGLDNSTNDAHPRVRAALPPLAWQTFDIDFHAPRFDATGNKSAKARITVLLNGVNVFDNQELDPPHGAAGRIGEAPTGPLMLQDHLTPLQYRNIWLVETKDESPRPQATGG